VTDAVQGIALIMGLLLLLCLVLEAGGGVEAAAAHFKPEQLGFFGSAEKSGPETLEQWAIPICGSVLSQELVARVLASRSPEVARRSCIYGGLLYLSVGLIPVTIGLFGMQLLPGLKEPEQILPMLAQQYLHTVFYVIFAGALISAILSTVDSALLAASALLSHNLIVPMLNIQRDAAKVNIARTMVLASGIIAFALALNAGRVYTLVEEASAFGSAGIFTVVMFGLFTSFGGAISAGVTLASGMLAWVVGHHVLDLATPYLVSLSVALASYILVASWESVRAGTLKWGLMAAWLRDER
jgi:Na+/proline symporter